MCVGQDIQYTVFHNVKANDTGKMYHHVVVAYTDNHFSNGYAFDPEEQFGQSIPYYQDTVGFARIEKHPDGSFSSAKTFVLLSYRRQGIASKMNDISQYLTQGKLTPSLIQSADGEKFTRKYFSDRRKDVPAPEGHHS